MWVQARLAGRDMNREIMIDLILWNLWIKFLIILKALRRVF